MFVYHFKKLLKWAFLCQTLTCRSSVAVAHLVLGVKWGKRINHGSDDNFWKLQEGVRRGNWETLLRLPFLSACLPEARDCLNLHLARRKGILRNPSYRHICICLRQTNCKKNIYFLKNLANSWDLMYHGWNTLESTFSNCDGSAKL